MKPQLVSEQDIQPHSIWQSIILHLLPGALLLVFFVLAVPVVESLGLPLRFAAILGVLLVLIPFELGVLFYEGKKRNGRFSLRGVVVYRERIPLWQYFLWVPLLVIWSSIGALLLSPFGDFLVKTVFSWLPTWFIYLDNSGTSKIILVVMVTVFGIANVSAAIVEELYFRGYLMPRTLSHKRLGTAGQYCAFCVTAFPYTLAAAFHNPGSASTGISRFQKAQHLSRHPGP